MPYFFADSSNLDHFKCILLIMLLFFDRIIHEGGFTRDDNKTYIPLIRSNAIQALVAIIRAMATLHIDFADCEREVFCFCVASLIYYHKISSIICKQPNKSVSWPLLQDILHKLAAERWNHSLV